MKKHTIELDDIKQAMDSEIILASSYRANYPLSKRLVFIPSDLKYQVQIKETNCITTSSYKNPQDAIDRYNEVEV